MLVDSHVYHHVRGFTGRCFGHRDDQSHLTSLRSLDAGGFPLSSYVVMCMLSPLSTVVDNIGISPQQTTITLSQSLFHALWPHNIPLLLLLEPLGLINRMNVAVKPLTWALTLVKVKVKRYENSNPKISESFSRLRYAVNLSLTSSPE